MRRIWIGLTIASLALAFTAPATFALTRVVVEQRSVAPLHFEGLDACLADYGFTYTGDYTRTRSITDYYAGETLVRTVIHIHFDGVETNDADPSRWLPAAGERLIVDDYEAGTRTETGTLRRTTAKGEGIVLQQAGKLVTDLDSNEILEVAGPHQFLFDDFDAFCEALGG